MQFDSQVDLGRVILAFAILCFLALVCLLKWQHRRHFKKARIERGLRVYVETQNEQQAA